MQVLLRLIDTSKLSTGIIEIIMQGHVAMSNICSHVLSLSRYSLLYICRLTLRPLILVFCWSNWPASCSIVFAFGISLLQDTDQRLFMIHKLTYLFYKGIKIFPIN